MTFEPNNPETNKTGTVPHTYESEHSTPELDYKGAKSSSDHSEYPPKMNGAQRFLRLSLIWLAVIVIAFLAGFLANHYVRYIPMQTALTEQLTQSQEKLELDKKNFQADLDSANLHSELLRTIVDLETAHIELLSNNLSGAKVAMSDAAARLERLKPLVETVDPNLSDSMQSRLKLITDSMEANSPTALIDLESLVKNLQSVETLLNNDK